MASGGGDALEGEEDLDEKDLFGSDNEEDALDAVDEKELFGSEGEDEVPQIDERALFGSDDEGDAATQPGASAAPGASQAPDAGPEAEEGMSEMDEREIFGDLSDDEPEKVEDVILRRRPAPSNDRVFVSLRLPNVLSVEKSAYSADTIPQTTLEGYKEYLNTQNKKNVRLLNPTNCIRWRFKKGPDGQRLTDEDGRPQYESNSRLVEWEDGTKTLYVGKEVFNINEIEDSVLLFEENSRDVHVCHGSMRKRLVATPRSLNSQSHEMLKRSQYMKFEPLRRSLLNMAEEADMEADTAVRQMLEAQRKRADKRAERDSALPSRSLREESGLTASFLEDDILGDEDAGIGASIQDVKQHFKRPKTG